MCTRQSRRPTRPPSRRAGPGSARRAAARPSAAGARPSPEAAFLAPGAAARDRDRHVVGPAVEVRLDVGGHPGPDAFCERGAGDLGIDGHDERGGGGLHDEHTGFHDEHHPGSHRAEHRAAEVGDHDDARPGGHLLHRAGERVEAGPEPSVLRAPDADQGQQAVRHGALGPALVVESVSHAPHCRIRPSWPTTPSPTTAWRSVRSSMDAGDLSTGVDRMAVIAGPASCDVSPGSSPNPPNLRTEPRRHRAARDPVASGCSDCSSPPLRCRPPGTPWPPAARARTRRATSLVRDQPNSRGSNRCVLSLSAPPGRSGRPG